VALVALASDIQGVDLFGWRLIRMPNEPHCLQQYRTAFIHFHAIFVRKSKTSKFLPGTTPTKSRPSIIILKNQIQKYISAGIFTLSNNIL